MNSLSKIALLATLFTVPFAGLAMDDGMDFNFFNSVETPAEVTVQATTQVAEVTVEVTEKVAKTLIEVAQENPAIAAGIALGAVVVGYTFKCGYNWLRGGSKATEASVTTPVKPTAKKLTGYAKHKAEIDAKKANQAK